MAQVDGEERHVPTLSRRSVLAGLGCALAGSLCVPHRQVIAAAGAQRLNFGAMRLTIVSDGTFTLPLSFVLPSVDRNEVRTLLGGGGVQGEAIEVPTNVVVVESGKEVVLIDAGAGTQFMPTLGKLPERLREAGVAHERITKVVFTHAHPDHLWGVIDDFDEANHFPNARYVIGAVEWDFWIAKETAERMPDAFKGMAWPRGRGGD